MSFVRPSFVEEALKKNEPLYYFGVGSNMLRSKVETRGMDGKPIEVISMQPAVVYKHRLAFNLMAFPPLEPAMGALEPVKDGFKSALSPYDKAECHGALIQVTPENYNRIMESEGVRKDSKVPPGYEEILVTAYPYDESQEPVLTVALRAKSHRRLLNDAAPSARYMKILKEGAAELGLKPCYQDYLANHPVQILPSWLRTVAVHNIIFSLTLFFGFKFPYFTSAQNAILYSVYVPPTAHWAKQLASNIAMYFILLPGSLPGAVIRYSLQFTSSNDNPFLARMMILLKDGEEKET